MQITLKSIFIENFRGIRSKHIEFGKRTLLKGRNRVGKTTIINALTYLLFDKDASGGGITDIRPHDEIGVDIDHIEVNVTAVFEVNGKEITLQKKQVQKWHNDVLQGNDNLYFVNDIQKKLKDYKQYISENIAEEDVLLFCICVSAFFRLDSKKRRQKLLDLVGEVHNADVLAADDKFAELEAILGDGTIDELLKRQNDRIKKFNKQKADIPARIDEVSKQIIDIDLSAYELERTALKREITECDAKIKDAGTAADSLLEQSLQLKFKLSEICQNMNAELQRKRSVIDVEICGLTNEISHLEATCRLRNKTLAGNEIEIAKLEAEKGPINKEYKENNAKVFDESKWVFDESSTVCSFCGQTLPADKIDALKAEFEERKANAREALISGKAKVKSILLEKADKIKAGIAELQAENKDLQAEIDDFHQKIAEATKKKEELEKQRSEIPDFADYTQNEEYNKIHAEHCEIEAKNESLKSSDTLIAQLEVEKAKLQEQLEEVNKTIVKAQVNEEARERIEELNGQLRSIAQSISNEERIKALLEQFNRRKMTMLTEKVNQYFDICEFKLFEKNVSNDGFKDICDIIVGGTNYERSLNGGDKRLADADLLVGFQKMVGISTPIFIDEAGVIDSDRLPETEQQLILLKNTDDKELTVEVY